MAQLSEPERELRTPDGWRVRVIGMVDNGRYYVRFRVATPQGAHVGTYVTPAQVYAALRANGANPEALMPDIDPAALLPDPRTEVP